MRYFRAIAMVHLLLTGAGSGWGANPAGPIDVTQRNAKFAPIASIQPDKRTPQIDRDLQDRRVGTAVLDLPRAGALPRAAIDIAETRPKSLRETPRSLLAPIPPASSPANRRAATISTSADAVRPPLVSRYQDGFTAAREANLARFPAFEGASTAKLSRFVFRKNAPDVAPVSAAAVAAPAGGGSRPSR